MDSLIKNYVFGDEKSSNIQKQPFSDVPSVTSIDEVKNRSLEDVILDKLNRFKNKTTTEIEKNSRIICSTKKTKKLLCIINCSNA